jgi:hypothetical protein
MLRPYRVPLFVLVCVLFVATATMATAPAFVTRGEVASPSVKISPSTPRLLLDWWDVSCYLTADVAPWCPIAVKDPPMPKPKVEPTCNGDGTCPDTSKAATAR